MGSKSRRAQELGPARQGITAPSSIRFEFGTKATAKEYDVTNTIDQEAFWKGRFGDNYTDRNVGSGWVAANTALFGRILARVQHLQEVLELGSNIGLNLMALAHLLPKAKLSAVEINLKAAAQLRAELPEVDLHVASIVDFRPERTWELVFTKGVLIHIDPAQLPIVYDLMYRASSRYLLICEYYNPSPTELEYRGHAGKLFKRDFAGNLLERFSDLALIDYGFVYHRDSTFPQDDLTWFLMEKR